MILILDGANDEYVYAIEEAYTLRTGSSSIITTQRAPTDVTLVVDEPGTLQIIREYPLTGDKATDRHTDLVLASQGARYWGPRLDQTHPTYAGSLPSIDQSETVLLDGEYSENRTKYMQSFGVKYTGRTYSSPKTFIILDAKRKVDAHKPSDNPKVGHLLASLTDDFWGLTALISTSSTKRLEGILDEHDQTIPITTSTATSAKLKFAGLDHVEAILPSESSKEYGISLRSSVTLFERQ